MIHDTDQVNPCDFSIFPYYVRMRRKKAIIFQYFDIKKAMEQYVEIYL